MNVRTLSRLALCMLAMNPVEGSWIFAAVKKLWSPSSPQPQEAEVANLEYVATGQYEMDRQAKIEEERMAAEVRELENQLRRKAAREKKWAERAKVLYNKDILKPTEQPPISQPIREDEQNAEKPAKGLYDFTDDESMTNFDIIHNVAVTTYFEEAKPTKTLEQVLQETEIPLEETYTTATLYKTAVDEPAEMEESESSYLSTLPSEVFQTAINETPAVNDPPTETMQVILEDDEDDMELGRAEMPDEVVEENPGDESTASYDEEERAELPDEVGEDAVESISSSESSEEEVRRAPKRKSKKPVAKKSSKAKKPKKTLGKKSKKSQPSAKKRSRSDSDEKRASKKQKTSHERRR